MTIRNLVLHSFAGIDYSFMEANEGQYFCVWSSISVIYEQRKTQDVVNDRGRWRMKTTQIVHEPES